MQRLSYSNINLFALLLDIFIRKTTLIVSAYTLLHTSLEASCLVAPLSIVHPLLRPFIDVPMLLS